MIATPDYDALIAHLGDPTLPGAELDEALAAAELPTITEARPEDDEDEGVRA